MARAGLPPITNFAQGTQMRRVQMLLQRIEHTLVLFAGISIMLMMVHIAADVFSKYFLAMPIIGTMEIVSNYYMVAVVFFPLAYIQSQRGHIVIEVFTRGLSDRATSGLDCVAAMLSTLYLFALTWTATTQAHYYTEIRESWYLIGWDLPVWWARWVVPLGMAVLLARFIIDTGKHARAAMSGLKPLSIH